MSEVKNIPDGWVETTLGKVTYFVNEKIDVNKINLKNYISTENLLADKLGIQDAVSLPNIPKVNYFKKEDVLFSNIRTYFKKVWFANFEGGSSNDVLIFRPINQNDLNSKFLYYFISSDKFIDFTVKSAKGTKMPRGDKEAMKLLKIYIPKDINEQKSIAQILTAFDNKIELLQAQNKTLEETAQTIFVEWFGKYSVEDELPDDWRVGKLGDEFEILMGQSPSGESYNTENEGMVFFQGRAEFTERFPKNRLYTTEPKRLAEKFDVLVSVRAPVGDINVASETCCVGRGLAAVKSKNKSYALYKLKFLKPKFDLFEGEGTVFGSINKDSFNNIEVIIPTDKLINHFENCINKLDLKIYNNHQQIQTLTKTRDELLPRLMSGAVRVKGN